MLQGSRPKVGRSGDDRSGGGGKRLWARRATALKADQRIARGRKADRGDSSMWEKSKSTIAASIRVLRNLTIRKSLSLHDRTFFRAGHGAGGAEAG